MKFYNPGDKTFEIDFSVNYEQWQEKDIAVTEEGMQ